MFLQCTGNGSCWQLRDAARCTSGAVVWPESESKSIPQYAQHAARCYALRHVRLASCRTLCKTTRIRTTKKIFWSFGLSFHLLLAPSVSDILHVECSTLNRRRLGDLDFDVYWFFIINSCSLGIIFEINSYLIDFPVGCYSRRGV